MAKGGQVLGCVIAMLSSLCLCAGGALAAETNPNELPEFTPRRPKPRASTAIRIDLLTPLTDGLVPIAVEQQLARQLTGQLVAEFGAWQGLFGRARAPFGKIEREPSGVGPLAGGQIDFGYWPGKSPFQKTVYRFGYAARSYSYESSFSGRTIGQVDQVQHLLLFGGGIHWLTGSVSLGFDGVIGIQLNEARKIAVVERQISDPFMTSYEIGSQDVGGGIHPLYPIGRFLIGVPF